MKNIIVMTAVALAVCGAVSFAQDAALPAAASAGSGLSDLNTVTFGCPKAALNAAARQAAKAPSQGTYQFSYFNIVSDSHHAAYEVHFKSNYEGEVDLKFCVTMYCQQGWDPATAKTEVTLIGTTPRPMKGAGAHDAACRVTPAPVKRQAK
jgi:hypothetical protein